MIVKWCYGQYMKKMLVQIIPMITETSITQDRRHCFCWQKRQNFDSFCSGWWISTPDRIHVLPSRFWFIWVQLKTQIACRIWGWLTRRWLLLWAPTFKTLRWRSLGLSEFRDLVFCRDGWRYRDRAKRVSFSFLGWTCRHRLGVQWFAKWAVFFPSRISRGEYRDGYLRFGLSWWYLYRFSTYPLHLWVWEWNCRLWFSFAAYPFPRLFQ